MVMDRPLSPQSVGREFVRQYYTLLNEAPDHLHRFYNNSSSFVHGGLGPNNRDVPTVVGQKQIHQQIQQLNFRDCHAKINQVDSQATLDNGVVVQVSGELSNAGLPMRRFTQTFVLAAQSPKKYYVHNDIFRYQDLLPDEELENETVRSELEEDHHENEIHQNNSHPPNKQSSGYYSGQVNGISDAKSHQPQVQPQQVQMHEVEPPAPVAAAPPPAVVVPPEPLPPAPPSSAVPPPSPAFNNIDMIQSQPSQPLQQHTESVSVETVIEGSRNNSSSSGGPTAGVGGGYMSQIVELTQPQQQSEPPLSAAGPLEAVPSPPVDSDFGHLPPSQPPPPQISSNEPKTYANLVKKGHNSVSGNVFYNSSPSSAPSAPQYNPPEPLSPPSQNKIETKGFDSRPPAFQSNGPKPPRPELQPRNSYNSLPRQQNNDETNGNSYGDDRRRIQYSDSQQVFIGNIPHNATEGELKELFGQFGAIVDFKLLSKSGSKGPPGTKVPHYGFITFEEVSSVQAVLNAKPILFPGGENGVKLNVEEKKAKKLEGGFGGGGGGRGGGGRGGGSSMMGGGGRGGGSMSRGGPRGGGVQRFNGGPPPPRR